MWIVAHVVVTVEYDIHMESLTDLLGNYRVMKPGGKIVDERSTLIGYFVEEIKRPAKMIGIRLQHYSLDQLYGLQASYKDRLRRDGQVTAHKYWWAVTRTKAVENSIDL